MDWFTPKYRRNPNEKIHTLYTGVSNGRRTVTRVVKVAQDCNHLEASNEYGPMLPRGANGRIGIFVLGGLETTLDEMEYIVQAKKEKPFKQQRSGGEIAHMCQLLIERRNDMVRYFRKNPSEAPKRPKPILYLPTGCRLVDTAEPGLQLVMRSS